MAAARPVREEENKGSTGRGLGLAAAAVGVGVGVGAALYYFFNKRQEEGQHAETSADQQHERAFVSIPSDDSSNSESSEDSSSVNSVSISSDDTPSSASSGDSSSEDSLELEFTGGDHQNGPNLTAEQEDMDLINAQIFRQRSWSLEECSICCEVMLPSSAPGGLRMLPCGHKFHTKCVQPWTEEHDTCPNCRKAC